MYLNKAIISGFLTRDPELKALPSGSKVASFCIATNRTWTDAQGVKQTLAEFHNIVAFAKTAELVSKYLFKGSQALVEGRIQTRTWENQTDGIKRYRTEIICENVQFGARSPKIEQGGAHGTQTTIDAETGEVRAPDKKISRMAGGTDEGVKTKPKVGGTEIEYPTDDIDPSDIPF